MQVTATSTWINTGIFTDNKYVSIWNFKIIGHAVGLTSGTRYNINYNQNSALTQNMQNGQFIFPLKDYFRLVSQGNTPNLQAVFSWNLVYNAKGEEIANTFDWSFICK